MSELRILGTLRKLVCHIYKIKFPQSEKYNLESQTRRSVVSVSLNIREGNIFFDKRRTTHYQRALGSLVEVDECLILLTKLNIITIDEYKEFQDSYYWLCFNVIKKMIHSQIPKDSHFSNEVSE